MARDRSTELSFWTDEQAAPRFPSARPASSAATGWSGATRNWSRSSAATTPARAAPGGAFKRCCRPAGHYDDTLGHYYTRDW